VTLLGGTQILLFSIAVGCVVTAFLTARARRVTDSVAQPWWRGQRGRVKPSVGVGWALFILLNLTYGAIQPLLACGIFMRAYLLRAVCLRRPRAPR
jgi:hypothetical protein